MRCIPADYTADDFFTGTALEVIVVRQIVGRNIGSGQVVPITLNLLEEFP
ncbi:hypothetical protein [Paenibacillus macquariensis]